MNGIRSIALIILGLLIGFVVNHYGMNYALLIFAPLFLLWFVFWDNKKFRQAERRENFNHYQTHIDSYR